MLMSVINLDRKRYAEKSGMPSFQKWYRKCQMSSGMAGVWYRLIFRYSKRRYNVELSSTTQIGPGLYIGHPYGITINPEVVIGKNCNIHKGVTIGQENRGERKGTPVLGDCVWVGINSTIVGNITIGNDVLIAPNTFVNKDVPDHSIVFGNPMIVKARKNATAGYINRCI